jgi:hypothetical protein
VRVKRQVRSSNRVRQEGSKLIRQVHVNHRVTTLKCSIKRTFGWAADSRVGHRTGRMIGVADNLKKAEESWGKA